MQKKLQSVIFQCCCEKSHVLCMYFIPYFYIALKDARDTVPAFEKNIVDKSNTLMYMNMKCKVVLSLKITKIN